MHTLWNEADRSSLVERFTRLSPGAAPRWGRFNAPRMVTHVTDALRSSLGELAVAAVPGPLKVWPLNTLVIYYLPWPKGAPTAPELIARTPAEWGTELEELQAAIDRFAARGSHGSWPAHAAFGQIDGAAWGRLMYRHLDHHLRQFGV